MVKFRLTLMSLLYLLTITCEKSNNLEPVKDIVVNGSIAKWFNNHRAAISLTHDHGKPNSEMNLKLQQLLHEKGLTIDYEIVTDYYNTNEDVKDFLLKTLIPNGFGYYGHGHKHVDHDALTYEEAYNSFRLCYVTMQNFGLKPIAYAYPAGGGLQQETRDALRDAGFLSGRMHFFHGMTKPCIIPGTNIEPKDWYKLPCLVMQAYEFNQCDSCVNNNDELIPYLDEAITKNAWIILAYHCIGEENGYGYYKWQEFEKNIVAIQERDFWNATLNEATLYIRERATATVEINQISSSGEQQVQEINILLSDNLTNDVYDQPLTILLDVPSSWIGRQVGIYQNQYLLDNIVFQSKEGKVSLKPNEIVYQLKLIEYS